MKIRSAHIPFAGGIVFLGYRVFLGQRRPLRGYDRFGFDPAKIEWLVEGNQASNNELIEMGPFFDAPADESGTIYFDAVFFDYGGPPKDLVKPIDTPRRIVCSAETFAQFYPHSLRINLVEVREATRDYNQ